MIIRREHESHAGFLNAAPKSLRRQINLHSQCLQHIGAAALRCNAAVAMLHHHRSRRRRHKHRGRRNIEQIQLVTASPANIESRPGQIERSQIRVDRVSQKFLHKRRDLGRALTLDRHGLEQLRLAIVGHRQIQQKFRREAHFARGHVTPLLKLPDQIVHAFLRITQQTASPEGILTNYHIIRPSPSHQYKTAEKIFPFFLG